MQHLVEQLSALLMNKNMMLVTAESCTGGLLATTLTHGAGASKFYERGFITYSNSAKHEALGVPEETIEKYGAVSAQVAELMAKGALENSHAQLAISITGIAGPDGGSAEKPVGLVFFGFALSGGSAGSIEMHFKGTRNKIQSQATLNAIKHLITVLKDNPHEP